MCWSIYKYAFGECTILAPLPAGHCDEHYAKIKKF